MTPEQLRALSNLSGFPASASLLIRVAGLEAAAALISAWPGQEWPVPASEAANPSGARRYAALAEIAGEEAARRIVRHYGGGMLYIPSCAAAQGCLTRGRVVAEYGRLTMREGYSHREVIFDLGIRYGKSYRAIEHLLNRPAEATPEQMELFGEWNG